MKNVRGWLWLVLAFALVAYFANATASPFPFLNPAPTPAPEPVSQITLYGRVDDSSAAFVIAKIHEANKAQTNKPIVLFIDSPGGGVLAGNTIINAIHASARPVAAVCVSFCASMGAIIFESGAHRTMMPNSILMLHEMSAGVEGDLSHMTSQISLLQRLNARFEVQLAKIAQLSLEEYHAKAAAQWWMLADEALNAHLADDVGMFADYPAS
jgi:ATP-dependent Clp protease protease subunit